MITTVAGVQGHCESGFGRVADVFAAQLRSRRDIGGSVGVYLDGKPVVGIWGGSVDPDRGVPWAEHTVTPIGSTSKALASTAVLILVDRGLLDLDEPVASYWPAFGQNGKEETTVRLALSHRSGVAALDVPMAIRSMLNPVWFRYALGVANRRSVSYRATFGATSVSYDDAEELVRYDVEDASAGVVGNGPSLARMFAALITST